MNDLKLCYLISDAIKACLFNDLQQSGFTGENMENPSDLKSTHEIDKKAASIATKLLSKYNCNVFIESVENSFDEAAEFSVYIDPVDGSLNWERGVGDPCVVIAISSKTKITCLNDLRFSFVYGLRSFDIYYSDLKQSYFISNITKKPIIINCISKKDIADATAYLRTGYGAAKQQLDRTLDLYTAVRDIRGIDNAAMEICEIARNAADVMVEARGISDFYNLLAYPILKTAGGHLTDLSGIDLGDQAIQFKSLYNYIACNNECLLTQVSNLISE